MPLADTAWMVSAQCRDHPPELFFPPDGAGVVVAQRVCAACPVRDACLDYAIVYRIDHGVWGGASERQRRRLARSKRDLSPQFQSTE